MSIYSYQITCQIYMDFGSLALKHCMSIKKAPQFLFTEPVKSKKIDDKSST